MISTINALRPSAYWGQQTPRAAQWLSPLVEVIDINIKEFTIGDRRRSSRGLPARSASTAMTNGSSFFSRSRKSQRHTQSARGARGAGNKLLRAVVDSHNPSFPYREPTTTRGAVRRYSLKIIRRSIFIISLFSLYFSRSTGSDFSPEDTRYQPPFRCLFYPSLERTVPFTSKMLAHFRITQKMCTSCGKDGSP